MNIRKAGALEVAINGQQYYLPYPLPPHDPPLQINKDLLALYGQAMYRLGQVNEMVERMRGDTRFLQIYAKIEGLYSADLDGISTTLDNVLLQEYSTQKPNKETRAVLNHSHALKHALGLVHEQGIPITSKIIRDSHAILFHHQKSKGVPGQFRQQPIHIGNILAPPEARVSGLILELKQFIKDDITMEPLIKAGLVLAQFESICPFMEGNGRIGRLLMILILIKEGLLKEPFLYPSYYFKKTRAQYIRHLEKILIDGDFEGWIRYFLTAIIQSAEDGLKRANEIEQLKKRLSGKIKTTLGKKNKHALKLLAYLFCSPIVSISEVAEKLQITFNSANALIKKMIGLNILVQTSQFKRNKAFVFKEYIMLLEHDLIDGTSGLGSRLATTRL